MSLDSRPSRPSPFLDPGACSADGSLAVLQLRRDLLLATRLSSRDDDDEGYDEGRVTNTRFGSFPHTTLIGLPWGSQVRASKVDTGSRGRRAPLKRKREANETVREAVVADTGFVHLLPPTPECWTASLPHRTQVVYTPDYSYILHRLRVRPGDVLIEAGAGSGSFTHAAARSVFNGYSNTDNGRVYSYEFHEQRVDRVQKEIEEHGLQGIVRVNHRDVCEAGFHVRDKMKVTTIFLDLPEPWLALCHLTRSPVESASVLDQKHTVRLCTFSPCIEQVQRTVTTARKFGWTDVEVTELSQRRIEVRRECLDDVNTVEEAVARLRDVEGRFRSFHEGSIKAKKRPDVKSALDTRQRTFKEGRLTQKAESDLRTHTSYLVFALLPREWSEDDERKARLSPA